MDSSLSCISVKVTLTGNNGIVTKKKQFIDSFPSLSLYGDCLRRVRDYVSSLDDFGSWWCMLFEDENSKISMELGGSDGDFAWKPDNYDSLGHFVNALQLNHLKCFVKLHHNERKIFLALPFFPWLTIFL